jgi:hypothetical protein
MTLINDVKKALGRSGAEMDAADIADELSRMPRYRNGVTRDQVSHALHTLVNTSKLTYFTGDHGHQPQEPAGVQPRTEPQPRRVMIKKPRSAARAAQVKSAIWHVSARFAEGRHSGVGLCSGSTRPCLSNHLFQHHQQGDQ